MIQMGLRRKKKLTEDLSKLMIKGYVTKIEKVNAQIGYEIIINK